VFVGWGEFINSEWEKIWKEIVITHFTVFTWRIEQSKKCLARVQSGHKFMVWWLMHAMEALGGEEV
jgi:hypothetical protein